MTLKAIMSDKNNCTKPGEAALRNMKLLQKESTVFKVPKLPKKKKTRSKTEVLDEDVYVQGIAKIIQRDFFPDLEKLKAQNEFLEATENKDYAKLREITRKYSSSRPPTEPYNSPATFDTPSVDGSYTPSAPTVREDRLQADVEVEPKEKNKDTTDSHTLDSFLASYTSEDNASYDRVIALEEKKRMAKLTDQLEAEVTSAASVQAALELPSMEQQADQSERPLELESWKFTARNYIMYVPSGAPQPPTAKPLLVHKNTRLQGDPFDHNKVKETITANAKTQDASISGKIGVDGVSINTAGTGDAQYPLLATPSPRPGVDHSPLMTWGEIEGTPFRLDGGDTPLPTVGAGAAYRMLEGGTRERLALQLAEKAARSRRATTPARTPSPYTFRTNTERLASMSPAAKKLAAKHLLSPRVKLTPNNVGILPTGSPRRRRIPTSRRTPLVATPGSANKQATLPSADPPTDNITDNLLQINVAKRQRLTAQDFFQ